MEKSELLNTIENQQTIRKYEKKIPDKAIINRCVEIAQRSPSTSNHQPYCIIEINDKILKNKLLSVMLCQDYVAESPLLFMVCIDWTRQDKLAIYLGCKNEINKISKIMMGVSDASIFAHSFVLALQGYGLASSYIASPYTAMLKVANILNLPLESAMPLHLISVGYPSEVIVKKPRYPKELLSFENNYKNPSIDKIAEYFENGCNIIEKEDYLNITGDSITTWEEHYKIKFGKVAKERTWDLLDKDILFFFNQKG